MFNKLQNSVRLTGVKTLAAALVLLVLGAPPVHAVPEIMTSYGDQMSWSSAEANAMGGTGTALYRGGLSNIFNPAFLVMESGRRLDANIALDQGHEDRFQSLFDSFDSWVVDSAIASNRNHYWQTGFGYAFSAGTAEQPVAIGLSLTDRYDFSYTFDEELRNPSPFNNGLARDLLTEQRQREITGTLRNLSLGVGSQINDRLSFGAALHYAFGNRTDARFVRDYAVDDGDGSMRSEDDVDFEGVNHTLGLRFVVNERVEIGAAWESALLVEGDRVTSYTDVNDTLNGNGRQSIEYPNIYRVGLTFRPQTDPRTVFTVELEYKPWSELKDSDHPAGGNPQNLNDVTDVRVGLEHTFYNGMPLRFGFRHYDSYLDRDASASTFSAGVGAPLGGGMVSVSMELSKVTSVQPHQFAYATDFFGENFHADPYARVEDTRFRVGVGYKVEF